MHQMFSEYDIFCTTHTHTWKCHKSHIPQCNATAACKNGPFVALIFWRISCDKIAHLQVRHAAINPWCTESFVCGDVVVVVGRVSIAVYRVWFQIINTYCMQARWWLPWCATHTRRVIHAFAQLSMPRQNEHAKTRTCTACAVCSHYTRARSLLLAAFIIANPFDTDGGAALRRKRCKLNSF